jgi:hypothetical protein
MSPKPKKRGRPANPDTRRERVLIRLNADEEASWRAAAAEAGHENVSTWARWVVNKAISNSG